VQERLHALASWQTEVLLYNALAGAREPLQMRVPALHAHGIIPSAEIPFVLAQSTATKSSLAQGLDLGFGVAGPAALGDLPCTFSYSFPGHSLSGCVWRRVLPLVDLLLAEHM
jgi:hypothetical protein